MHGVVHAQGELVRGQRHEKRVELEFHVGERVPGAANQISHLGVDAEFFEQLTSQAFCVIFPGLEFSSWKFPKTCMLLSRGATGQEHTAVVLNDSGSNPQTLHGCCTRGLHKTIALREPARAQIAFECFAPVFVHTQREVGAVLHEAGEGQHEGQRERDEQERKPTHGGDGQTNGDE